MNLHFFQIIVQEESLRSAKADFDRCEDALQNVLLNICHVSSGQLLFLWNCLFATNYTIL